MNHDALLHFCEIADYESAIRAVDWPPDLLSSDGERLLVWGIICSQKGAAEQTKGEQELAKDCLSRAIELLHGKEKELARIHLALCYWRLGDLDSSKVILSGVFQTPQGQFNQCLVGAILEDEVGELENCLQLLGGCERLLDHVSLTSRGKFHNHKALALAQIGSRDQKSEFHDRAIIEFTAADYYFADAPKLRGAVKSNLARLYSLTGQMARALRYVNEALDLAAGDKALQARWHDQAARIYLDHRDPDSAQIECAKAVSLLADGEQTALLQETLETLNKARGASNLCLPPTELRSMSPLTHAKRILEADPNLALDVISLIAKVADSDGNPDKFAAADAAMQFAYQYTPQGEQNYRDYLAGLTEKLEVLSEVSS